MHPIFDLNWWQLLLVTLGLTHVTIASVTIFLHRSQAHRAVDLGPLPSHFFRFWLWLTTGMVTREWVAVHRKHHAKCETAEDPHSPQVEGLNRVLWGGAWLYRKATQERETLDKYGRGTPDDLLERKLYARMPWLGVSIMLFVDLVLFGLPGLLVWGVQMIWIPFWAAGVINGLAHFWGYRNWKTADASTNISPWGILIGGEELHNNHHTYPNSAKLSAKWYEFDLGWAWIRLFEICGLAKVISKGPVVARVPEKNELDKDAAWALLNDRFRVMARYSKEVVAPVMEQEYKKADQGTRKLIKRARKVFCRESSLLDEPSLERINAAVESSPNIAMVHDLHQQLLEIWAKRGGNMEEVINALREWCREAEASGMQSLREFADTLKSYTTPHTAAA